MECCTLTSARGGAFFHASSGVATPRGDLPSKKAYRSISTSVLSCSTFSALNLGDTSEGNVWRARGKDQTSRRGIGASHFACGMGRWEKEGQLWLRLMSETREKLSCRGELAVRRWAFVGRLRCYFASLFAVDRCFLQCS